MRLEHLQFRVRVLTTKPLALVGTLIGCAPALAAQLSARADFSLGTRYAWHGIPRAAGLAGQPSLAAGLRLRGIAVEGGVVTHYEIDRVAAGELTETGTGAGWRRGEDDLWARVTLHAGPARIQAGVVRYLFHGDPARGGLGPEHNTTELYTSFSTFNTYLNPTVETWWDVDRVRGAYVHASAAFPLMAWPYAPYIFAHIDGDIGLNLGQRVDPAQPGQLANFAGRGVTHAGIGAAVDLRPGHPLGAGKSTITLGFRSQLSFDEATRVNGAGRFSDNSFWVWTSVTLLLGGAAR